MLKEWRKAFRSRRLGTTERTRDRIGRRPDLTRGDRTQRRGQHSKTFAQHFKSSNNVPRRNRTEIISTMLLWLGEALSGSNNIGCWTRKPAKRHGVSKREERTYRPADPPGAADGLSWGGSLGESWELGIALFIAVSWYSKDPESAGADDARRSLLD